MTSLFHNHLQSWKLEMGAQILDHGSAQFRVWAPYAKTLAVKRCDDSTKYFPMKERQNGIFEVEISEPINDYLYVIDDTKEYPDPVSRWQPDGVHGPSRIVNPNTYKWHDQEWRGLSLNNYIIYELHVGTFTPEGTFEAIIPKLQYLRNLGITAIELMPVAQFSGCRNWGYDGTYLYAPQNTYGGPEALKNLVNACHQEGIAVIMDVVYNHLGPEGNYLREFGPYFTDKYRTPWGDAINYDGQHSNTVRRYIIENALYWVTEYHIDALRLDAIHAIFDFSPKHILEEISEAIHKQGRYLNREIWVTAESDLNDTRVIKSTFEGGYGVDAQWSDDFHHAIHSLLTGNQHSYFSDFGSLKDLQKALTEHFVYDGKWSNFRIRQHGASALGCAGSQFIVYNQNHDQIANASLTERFGTLVSSEQEKLAAVLIFCSSNIPLLFMGQEWGAKTPFIYFTNHEDKELGKKVSQGYQWEYPEHARQGKTVDPQNEDMFLKSKINWSEQKSHAHILEFFKQLIQLRKTYPALSNCRTDMMAVKSDERKRWLTIKRKDPSHAKALIICNFAETAQTLSVDFPKGKWQLALDSADPKYGGQQTSLPEQIATLEKSPFNITLEPYSAKIFTLTSLMS